MILQLRAEVDDYQRKVRAATQTVDQQLGLQEKRVKKLEAELQRSTSAMGGALRGFATTLATYFTGRELVGLLDSFTRLQNNLRVAGIDGENMATVQDRLFQSAQRYGVAVESLSSLFSSLSQSSKELGASQEQIFGITDAVSASLKITGLSAQEAQGALLHLGQALRGGKVQAEEYNSLLDGLYPLLEAAAAGSARWGGSVAKLTEDVKKGTVTSQEFFNSILAGSEQLEGKAASATLTLSAGFTTLTNALTIYFGEADKANGVSAALGATMAKLAENLNTIIPALAAIAVGLGVGFVANAIRARIAAVALAEGLTLAGASGLALGVGIKQTGVALLNAFGGPVGLAITGVALAFGYLASEASAAIAEIAQLNASADAAESKADQLEARLRDAGVSVTGLGNAASGAAGKVDGLNSSMGRAIDTAFRLAAELSKLEAVQIAMKRGANEREKTGIISRAQASTLNAGIGFASPEYARRNPSISATDKARIEALERENAALDRQFAAVVAASKAGVDISKPRTPGGAPAPTRPSGGGRSTSGGRSAASVPSGPSATEIAQRFNSELASYSQQALSAMQSLALNAEERAEYELRSVEIARLRTVAEIDAEKNYSAVQKDRLKAQVEDLAELERQVIERKRFADTERDAQDLADERYRTEQDALRLQYDLADTQAERRDLALRILDAEDAYLKSKLEAVIASQVATDAEKERARITLAALNAQAGARREGTERQFEGALAKYSRDAKDANTRVEEAAARRIADLNDTIADTMAKKLGIKDPFLRDLLGIFLDTNIFGPLAEALSRRNGGGGGGLLGGLLNIGASLFSKGGGFSRTTDGGLTGGFIRGRASGGRVNAGEFYRVNEGAGAGRVEGFIPQGAGTIIPLGQMNAMRTADGGSGQVTVRLMLSDDIDARIDERSGAVAVEVVRASADPLTERAVNETLRRANRPRM